MLRAGRPVFAPHVHPPESVDEVLNGLGFESGHGFAEVGPRFAQGAGGNPDDAAEEQGRAGSHADDDRRVDAKFRHVALKEDDRPGHHRDDAAHSEDAEGRDEKLHHDQRQPKQDERQSRVVHGQDLEGVQGQQQTDAADDAGHQGAGIVPLEDQAVDADHQQDVGQGRVGDDGQELGAPVGLDLDRGQVGRFEDARAVVHAHFAPVDGGEQFRQAGGDDIDDLLLQRLGRGEADGLAHRAFGPYGVAAMALGKALDVGHRVVDDFAAHGVAGQVFRVFRRIRAIRRVSVFFQFVPGAFPRQRRFVLAAVPTADLHRRGRAEIGGRSHGRNVAGIHDVRSGAGRAGPGRRDPCHHRHLGGQDLADDVAHGGVKPAGGVDAQHDHPGPLQLGPVDVAHDVVAGGGADGVIDGQDVGLLLFRDRFPRQDKSGKGQNEEHGQQAAGSGCGDQTEVGHACDIRQEWL